MTISLIHPSRGRPQKALETFRYWMEKASGEHTIEHILSIDQDDPRAERYSEQEYGANSLIFAGNNTCVVEATNKAAKFCKGDILVYLSDDFKCPQDWDKLIVQRTLGVPVFMLRVNDGYQPMENDVLTIPIMSRGLYKELGYFFYPEYRSMWVDCDLFHVTRPYMIVAPELVFKHEHPAAGFGRTDETYKRSEANWNQGKAIFERRSKEFGWKKPFKKMPV